MKMEDKSFIEKHLQDIEITVNLLNEGIQDKKWDKYKTAGMGTFLANVCNGYENIFRTLLKIEGIEIPKGEDWHKNLIRTAKSRGLSPDEMSETLDGMLNFRHVQVHGYSHKLEEKKLRSYSLEVVQNHPAFEKHIQDIVKERFLDT